MTSCFEWIKQCKHHENENNIFLVFRKSLQEVGEREEYVKINFTQKEQKFCLCLCYNYSKSRLHVKGTEINKFRTTFLLNFEELTSNSIAKDFHYTALYEFYAVNTFFSNYNKNC